MEVAEAFSLISRAIDIGRVANGYLVVGDLRGSCETLTEMVLKKLFPNELEQIGSKTHPDVAWLEPTGAKRIITIGLMRERIVEPMAVTSFSGGWKVGVIVGADRMEAPSANAFLKSLEEPSQKTLYLMLTDQPDAILPTIMSRSQRIDLPIAEDILQGDDYEAVADAFAARDAAALADKLAELRKDADDSDAQFVRKRFFKTLMGFARQMMASGKLPRFQAFRNVEAIEDAYRQSERSMGGEMVLSFMMDRIVFPRESDNA